MRHLRCDRVRAAGPSDAPHPPWRRRSGRRMARARRGVHRLGAHARTRQLLALPPRPVSSNSYRRPGGARSTWVAAKAALLAISRFSDTPSSAWTPLPRWWRPPAGPTRDSMCISPTPPRCRSMTARSTSFWRHVTPGRRRHGGRGAGERPRARAGRPHVPGDRPSAELGRHLPWRPARQRFHHRRVVPRPVRLTSAGFLIERLREPRVPEEAVTVPRNRRWQRLALFLHIGRRRAFDPDRPRRTTQALEA